MAARAEKEAKMIKLFDKYDKNGDGHLSVNELKLILKALGVKKNEVTRIFRQVFQAIDVNCDGMVTSKEFVKWLYSSSQRPEQRHKDVAETRGKFHEHVEPEKVGEAAEGRVDDIIAERAAAEKAAAEKVAAEKAAAVKVAAELAEARAEALDDFMEKVDDFKKSMELDCRGSERGIKPTFVKSQKNYGQFFLDQEEETTKLKLKEIFDYIDCNGTGEISLTEFIEGSKRLHLSADSAWLTDIFLLLDHEQFNDNYHEQREYTPAEIQEMREVAVEHGVGPPLFLENGCADPRSRYHICAFVEEEVRDGEQIKHKFVYDPKMVAGDHAITWKEFQAAFYASDTTDFGESAETCEVHGIIAHVAKPQIYGIIG